MSKNYPNAKRTDLAFISFESNDQAKNAFNNYKDQERKLGDRIKVNFAFSDKILQNKRKLKEKRKVVKGNLNHMNNSAVSAILNVIKNKDENPEKLTQIFSSCISNLFVNVRKFNAK